MKIPRTKTIANVNELFKIFSGETLYTIIQSCIEIYESLVCFNLGAVSIGQQK